MALLTPHLPDTCSSYYELLGLSAFAADLKIIDARAKELMREARKYQVGRYASQAEKHLNLLAEARNCLLDVKRKAQYDEDLRNKWQFPPVSVTTTFQLAEPRGSSIPDFGDEGTPLRSRTLVERARRKRKMILFVGIPGTIVLCVVLGILGVWVLASRAAGSAVPLNEALRQVFHSQPSTDSQENQPGEK